MENFVFYNPVRVKFGRGVIAGAGKEAAVYGRRALLVYGGGSIRRNGVYDAVAASLKEAGVSFEEYSGVQPNPVLSHAAGGVKKARASGAEVIIAAGGGSVIDEAKAIAAGALAGDTPLWSFFTGEASIKAALPLIAVPTLPAAGSEMNSGFVITNEDTAQKYPAGSRFSFPKVSLLDPSVTFTLPRLQTACGAVDAMSHLLEGYFSAVEPDNMVTDGLTESLCRTIAASTVRLQSDPEDYAARASMMWASSLALNGLGACGYRGAGFLFHGLEHSLSAIHGIPHGAGLAITIPACLKYLSDSPALQARLSGFAERVLDLPAGSSAGAAIKGLEDLFSGFGAPVRLGQAGINKDSIPALAENAAGLIGLWGLPYGPAELEKMLQLAV